MYIYCLYLFTLVFFNLNIANYFTNLVLFTKHKIHGAVWMHENRIFELCKCFYSMCRKKNVLHRLYGYDFSTNTFCNFFSRFSSSCLQMLLIYYNVHSHYFSICLLLFLSLFRPRKSEPIFRVCIDWENA